MDTFLTDLMKKGYTQDEIYAVIFKSERERKRRRIQAIVIETVAAHRLKNMREFLAYQELATWRRMNGFDRGVKGKESCFYGHRSLPSTPQEYYTGLWSEVNALNDAISLLRQKASNLINAIEQGKVSDREFATLKRLVEKRDREAVQVTVTQVGTVQHSSPCPLDPESSQMYVLIWKTTRGGWTQRCWRNSNHHRLVRVSSCPDSRVPRTRGHGSKDEPPPTAS